MPRAAFFKFALTSFLLTFTFCGVGSAYAKGPRFDEAAGSRVAVVAIAELPRQGQETYQQILRGEPFARDKDGTVFGNRERQLPARRRGYYREYTVPTPGARDRGARRIVCGGESRLPEVCYYTADHYASFRQIVR